MRRGGIVWGIVLCAVLLGGCRDVASAGKKIVDSGMEYLVGDETDDKLLHALSAFNYEGMREAVEAGADVNQMPALSSVVGTRTPLHWLLTGEGKIGRDLFGNWTNTDFTEYLLEQGADPDYADGRGRTLLMLCCEADGYGYMCALPLLRQLLAHGADVALTDRAGRTALDYAVMCGRDDYIALLLSHGAVPTRQTLTLTFTAPRDDYFLSIRALTAKTIYDACPPGTGAEGFAPLLLSALHGDSGAVISGAAGCPKEDLAMLAQLAIAFCNLDAVRAVRDAGFSYTIWKGGETSDDGWPYVELALLAGCEDTALWLLAETGYPEGAALRFAAGEGLTEMTAFFLARGAIAEAMPEDPSPGFKWEYHNNLLAESAGNVEVIRLLVEAGYPTNAPSLSQALNEAIVKDELESVRYLCEEAGADAAYLPEGIDSALTTACLHGNLAILEYLLEQGASLDAEAYYLHAAVIKHHTVIVEYLLQHGVSPDSREVYADGTSAAPPLFDAIRDGRLELVRCLVEAGADVNGKSVGEPILHCAAQSESARILQYIIDTGADVTAVDGEGKNAADYAYTQERLDLLANAGCIPTETNS